MAKDVSPGGSGHLNRNFRIGRNIVALTMGQIFTGCCSIAMIVLLPAHLGSSDLGRYSLAFLLVTFLVPLTDLGSSTYLTKEIPRSDPERAALLITNVIIFRLPLILLTAGLGAIVSWFFIPDHSVRLLFLLLLPTLIGQVLLSCISGSLRGMQEMVPVAIADCINRGIVMLLLIVMIAMGFGVKTITASTSIGSIFAVAYAVWSLVRKGGLVFKIEPGLWRIVLLSGLPFFISQTAVAFHGQIDVLILSRLANVTVVGWYAAAYRIITLILFIPTIVISAFFPAISESAAKIEEVSMLTRRALQLVLIGTLPLALGMVVMAGHIVSVLHYGEDFRHSIPLIAILALYVPIVGANMVICIASFALDLQNKWLRILLIATTADVVLNIALVPLAQQAWQNGAIASAGITVATELLVLFMGLRVLPKAILGWHAVVLSGRCLAAALTMTIVVLACRTLPWPIQVGCGAIAFAIAVVAWRAIAPAELFSLLRHLRRPAPLPVLEQA